MTDAKALAAEAEGFISQLITQHAWWEDATVQESAETGQVWARPHAEFFDGRFERVT